MNPMWTPHTLPYIVEKAAREYFEAADFLTENALEADTQVALYAESLRMTAGLLDDAPMVWMDTDVCQLVAESAGTVPAWSPGAVMPGESGLLAFEEPVAWIDCHDPRTPAEMIRNVQVDAIGWQMMDNPRGVRVSVFTGDSRPRLPWTPHTPMSEVLWAGLDPDQTHDGTPEILNNTGIPQVQSAQIVATLGAAWLLMAQPTVVEDGPTERARVRRRPAAGRRTTGRAEVAVSTRRLTAPASGGKRGRSGRKATTRWWVRGHWRQQAWGKKRTLRRPVWIAPHTAGHPDADVDDRPQVQVWRKGW